MILFKRPRFANEPRSMEARSSSTWLVESVDVARLVATVTLPS